MKGKIVKLSDTQWEFDGVIVDLDNLSQKADLVSDVSHHPREAIARLRSMFAKSVADFTFWKRNTAWGDFLNINNRVEYVPDDVFIAIGSVTSMGTWRSEAGKINGYPFSTGKWVKIVDGMKGDYPPLPSKKE